MEVLCLFVDKSACFLVVVVMQDSTVPDVSPYWLTKSLLISSRRYKNLPRLCCFFAVSFLRSSVASSSLFLKSSLERRNSWALLLLTYHFSNKTLNYGHRFWSCGVSWTTLNLQILAIYLVYIFPLIVPAPGLIN